MSGVEKKPVYTPDDLAGFDPGSRLGAPGAYPFTRGIHPTMYRGRLWTMRQFAGFGSAEDTNRRYKFLLEHGQTGLSVAFDFPTLMGYDSDHPRAEGEVGKCGVAISSLADMEDLFRGIPLDQVSTSMTINGPAAMLFCFYVAAAEKQGVASTALRGTVQNDILKEYMAQHAWVYPVEPALKIIVDMFEWCATHTPLWNTISISGYHIREAGATAAQELAFTLANGFTYVERGIARGLDVDAFAPRLSFFWDIHNDFFEEIAKLRAARRIWARHVQERYGAKNPRSAMMRFHSQTAEIQSVGGVVKGIESGWFQRQIARSAEEFQRDVEAGGRILVGVNDYVSANDHPVEILKVSGDAEESQRRRLARLRAERDNALVAERLAALRGAARADENVIGPMLDCARAYCTLYEIRHALESVYGAYREPVFF